LRLCATRRLPDKVQRRGTLVTSCIGLSFSGIYENIAIDGLTERSNCASPVSNRCSPATLKGQPISCRPDLVCPTHCPLIYKLEPSGMAPVQPSDFGPLLAGASLSSSMPLHYFSPPAADSWHHHLWVDNLASLGILPGMQCPSYRVAIHSS
jgi:hypothetical protein